MAPPRPTRKALPVTRRRHPEPEVIRLTQGQLPKLADAVEATEAEPGSRVRGAWPGRGNIEQIFRDAQRLKA
jgi:hypothetical protein